MCTFYSATNTGIPTLNSKILIFKFNYLYTFLPINYMTRNRKISGVASKFQSESATDTERIRCHGDLGTLVIWVQSTSPSASEAHAKFPLRVHRDVIKETGDMGTP